MSPATHAVLGAAIAGLAPRMWVAVPIAFLSHFFCDAFYHFEAFYPLSRKLGTSHQAAALITFVALGLALAPFLWRYGRNDRNVQLFYVFVAGACLLRLVGHWTGRTSGGLLLAAVFLLLSRSVRLSGWVLCGFAAVLPDLMRQGIAPLNRFHIFMHYEGVHDLGDLLYRHFRQQPSLFVGDRFDDPYYVAGYALELLIELAILVGSLHLMVRASKAFAPESESSQG
jgi:hypothetical protein